MNFPFIRRSFVLMFIAALVATACAGAGDDAPGPDAGDSPGQADDTVPAEADGDPYILGYVTDLSGIARDSYAPVLEGFELYFDSLNAEGGIDGHPVEVVVRDDESTGDRSVSGAIELVTREDAIAIFGLSLSSTHQAVFDALEEEQVPVITGFSGVDSTLPSEPATLGFTAGNVAGVVGTVGGEFISEVADEGTVVCTTIDTVGGVQGCENSENVASEAGFDVGGRVVFPIAATDFGPIARDIIGNNPNVVIGHYGSSWHQRMIAALRAEGYEGPYVAAPWGTSEQSLQAGVESGGVGEGVFFYTRYAVANDDAEGVAAFREAAEEHGTDFELQNPHLQGWGLARIAHETLGECGYPCSSSDFAEALTSVEVDMNGITGGPISFSEDDHHGTSWWRLYEVESGGTLTPATDWLEHQPPSAE